MNMTADTGQDIYEALEALLPTIQMPLQWHLFQKLGNLQSAEDALQEALLKAWVALKKGTGYIPAPTHDALQNWLFVIAKNVAIDVLRKRKYPVLSFSQITEQMEGYRLLHDLEISTPFLVESSTEAPEAFEDQIALNDWLQRGLQHLPAKYAQPFYLHAIEGWTHAEIAQLLHMSEAAIKQNIFRARKKLVAFYQNYDHMGR